MSYLIDTNIIAEVRKGKRCDPHVAKWWGQTSDDDLFLSVLEPVRFVKASNWHVYATPLRPLAWDNGSMP